MARPDLLPARWQGDVAAAAGDETALARLVCDYVSGMTDRYAIDLHGRLIGGPARDSLRALPVGGELGAGGV